MEYFEADGHEGDVEKQADGDQDEKPGHGHAVLLPALEGEGVVHPVVEERADHGAGR